jgi:hypothetical protein
LRTTTWTLFVALLVTACGTGEDAGETTTNNSTTSTSINTTTSTSLTTTTALSSTTTAPFPEFPPEVGSLEHGGKTWVAVLAGSEDSSDPILTQATENADAAGYNTGPTDCDFGAAQALGFPEENNIYTVSVYLSNQADAEQAVLAFEERGIGATVAEVQTFCLD